MDVMSEKELFDRLPRALLDYNELGLFEFTKSDDGGYLLHTENRHGEVELHWSAWVAFAQKIIEADRAAREDEYVHLKMPGGWSVNIKRSRLHADETRECLRQFGVEIVDADRVLAGAILRLSGHPFPVDRADDEEKA